ncbi:MAG: DinB family protein [Bacteroidetes bacterium]|nr:MAG: DinB family protein [Bacteroidota bacterium]TAG85377.1 MAG: DinB family protein [Bacteroidota bacterium]
MTLLTDFLKNQIIDSHNWVNKLLNNISDEKWFVTPEIIMTNFAWQLGHLTLSQYYYTVVLLDGPNKDFAEKINMKKYSGLFANGQKRGELFSEITVDELKEKWDLMQNQTIKILDNLQDKDLNNEIFKLLKPHPFVKTKENSISWNVKHTMWHCGQIATLRRIIDKPLDYGM